MTTLRQRLDQLAKRCAFASAMLAPAAVARAQELVLPADVPELIEATPPGEITASHATAAPPAEPMTAPPAMVVVQDDSPGPLPPPVEIEAAPMATADAVAAETLEGSNVGFGDQRPVILFQPAVPDLDSRGQSILRPTVQVADEWGMEILPTPVPEAAFPEAAQGFDDGRLRLGEVVPSPNRWRSGVTGEGWTAIRDQYQRGVAALTGGVGSLLRTRRAYDKGLGVERLPFALFEIDSAQPNNNFRLRFESAYDWEYPDRAEFFWSKLGGKGPPETVPVESSVDYQDVRLAMEVGTDKFSATTEIPLRFVDPTVLANTGGMGDMVLTAKTVLFDGERLQVTQVLRNQLATGSAKKGRGVGHASMEPGVVLGLRRTPHSMWHSELKLWFPIAGDPDHSGPVLRYGTGYARVWYDRDTLAIIPTFELVGWSVLTGGQTVPGPILGTGQVVSIDGLNILNLYPGVRIARDTGGDLGLFELGINGGFSVSDSHWYESLLRLELRWTF